MTYLLTDRQTDTVIHRNSGAFLTSHPGNLGLQKEIVTGYIKNVIKVMYLLKEESLNSSMQYNGSANRQIGSWIQLQRIHMDIYMANAAI